MFAMFGVGALEILIILCVGCVWVGVVAAVAIVAWRGSHSAARSAATPPVAAPVPPHPPQQQAYQNAPDDAEMRQSIIARLTQRFCPQCRSPLAADSPEGLCPACLMAGGLASVSPAMNGMAVTTPPSGSQPPAAGEWADLQQRFPDLEILELLGRGGMGSVFKARQKNLDRLVALKVIPPEAAKDPAFVERFNREAKAMARLNHPNIVTVYNFGHEGELCWLMMEYVDGVNLRHTLQASRLAPREALAIVPQICDALQYAHDQGVVHRDIKPENVLLDRSGRVKIADFGLAKLLGKGPADFTLTRTQQVMGTPRYMAPEQIERPTAVDHRADIYSLGVVIYEMLTGELPLGRFEPPSKKVQVDVRIDEVVLRTLEKEPDRRYQRASQLKTELASAASWPQAAAAPVVPQPIPPQPSWHTPAPATKPTTSDPGGVPLNQVLGVAFGMVMGVVVVTCGLAAGLFGMSQYPLFSGEWWGWAGGGFGSLIGGLGSLFGSNNSYRQMAGAEDLLRSPRVTWFDWVMRGYLLLGIALMGLGLVDFPDGNPTPVSNWPLFLLGGIAAFQAGLFLAWRMVVRPIIAAGGRVRGPQSPPAEPDLFRGVLFPAGAILAVLAIMWVDVRYIEPGYGLASRDVSRARIMIRTWHDAILLTGVVLVPLCLVGLAAWRSWGPRTQRPDGTWQSPYPFAARGWLWAVAALACSSLVVPWFCLQVVDNVEIPMPVRQVYPRSTDGLVSFVARTEELRAFAAMSGHFRYAHRGIEKGTAAGACLLIAIAAVLVSLAGRPGETWRGIFLAASSAVGLLLVVVLLHDTVDGPQWLTVDRRTEEGLMSYLTRIAGERPYSVAPLLPALRHGYFAQPAIGMFLALAAGGLAFFIAVTELCWGPAAGPVTAASTLAAKPQPLDPAREAVLRRVAGPAAGLIIAGLIGILPVLIVLLGVPAVVLVPQQEPSNWETTTRQANGLPIPVAQVTQTAPSPALATLFLPILVAQQMPEPQADAMPTWAVVMPLMAFLFLVDLAISVPLIFAGWRMRQLKSYGLSLVGAILAMLPCSFGWIVGLPMGIWAFSVLQQPDVRQAFHS